MHTDLECVKRITTLPRIFVGMAVAAQDLWKSLPAGIVSSTSPGLQSALYI